MNESYKRALLKRFSRSEVKG